MSLAQHLSLEDRWYTPINIIESARTVLGPITFDPASDESANQFVAAQRYITEQEDGLKTDWSTYDLSNVFLNPPGGKFGGRSKSILFWNTLMKNQPNLGHAIYVGFSIEQLQTSQVKTLRSILDFPFCIPSRRLKYINGRDNSLCSPTHASVIVYVPGRINETKRFLEEFSQYGHCKS